MQYVHITILVTHMPTHAKDISRPCQYFGRNGTNCGKPSYNGTCKIHRNRTSMKPCIVCKKGTHSMTGYCPCTFRQIYIGQKMKRASDEQAAFDREMDEYIQHLIDTFEPS